jgi:hypothetical protein
MQSSDPQYPFLIQLNHRAGIADSVAAVAAGADSVRVIPLASALIVTSTGNGLSFRTLPGVRYVLVLSSATQYGKVTINFAKRTTPADISLIRSLSIGTYSIAFNPDSTSVVVYLRYASLNEFTADSNAVSALIDPSFYFPI